MNITKTQLAARCWLVFLTLLVYITMAVTCPLGILQGFLIVASVVGLISSMVWALNNF